MFWFDRQAHLDLISGLSLESVHMIAWAPGGIIWIAGSWKE